ncbi:MAG TPA: hypothetical protein PLS50_08915, partial [Candidatus Dojkabacteria bacterium]|nr:hypothetical protein [Candidatus Dojkabacteria bacterium]
FVSDNVLYFFCYSNPQRWITIPLPQEKEAVRAAKQIAIKDVFQEVEEYASENCYVVENSALNERFADHR